jgi:hypothetical protein
MLFTPTHVTLQAQRTVHALRIAKHWYCFIVLIACRDAQN